MRNIDKGWGDGGCDVRILFINYSLEVFIVYICSKSVVGGMC